MVLRTALTQALGITHPIISAPMAMVSGGLLAASVTAAGGLGLIGGSYCDLPWIKRELRKAGNTRVGVGLITWKLAEKPQMLDHILEQAPAAILLSFGDPRPYIGRTKAAGVRVICQVQSMDGALLAADSGADIIVAQGTEAGGHTGSRTTMTLVPATVDAVAPIPVLAAGGISDGRGLAAALNLGASGVLVGTRFFASVEALGHNNTKERLISAGGDDTLLTRVFDMLRGLEWPSQYQARAVGNSISKRWHGAEESLRKEISSEGGSIVENFQNAMVNGVTDQSVVIGGQGLDLVDAIEPAGMIVSRMVSDAEETIAKTHAMIGSS